MDSFLFYVLLVAAWTIYLAVHSILASVKVKTLAYKYITPRRYRLLYSILSIVWILGLLYLNGAAPGKALFEKSPVSEYAALLMAGAGILLLRAAFKQYSLKEFLGLQASSEESGLKRSGILARIRHPVYSATLLITLGFLLYDPRVPTLISMLCIWIYLPAGIYFEEKKLIKKHGEAYLTYKNEVPALIPRIKFSGQIWK